MFLRPFPSSLVKKLPKASNPELNLHYLGAAGFVLQAENRTIALDPFLSRPGILKTIFSTLVPDKELIAKTIPQCDDVLVGHSHHDHIMDVPFLCEHTGARLIGSPSACNVGRAAGLPESQLCEIHGRTRMASGDLQIEAIPSLHGKIYLNQVSLTGKIESPPQWPARFWNFRHGAVYNWLVDTGKYKVLHIDSADFIEEELEGLEVDVLCLCAIGRKWRKNYVESAVRILRPKMVIPCHWDWFFTPFKGPHRMLPFVNLAGMLDEIRSAGAEPLLLPIDSQISF